MVTLARDDSITTQFAFHRGSTSLSGYGGMLPYPFHSLPPLLINLFYFFKGAVPYGTCTWTDRAVYAAEPKVIIYTSTVDKIKCRAAGGSWSCSSANPVSYPLIISFLFFFLRFYFPDHGGLSYIFSKCMLIDLFCFQVESAIFALSRSAVPPQKTFNVYNAGTQFIITSVV